MLFLDPNKPTATCNSESCDGCILGKTLHCHFKPRDLAHFLSICLPTFLVGGAGVYHESGWLFFLWILMIIGYFPLLEIRVMCTHCPHYAGPGGTLRCWANYGALKLWAYRPGPMSSIEKSLFLGGSIIIWGYPLVFLVIGMQWFFLVAYIVCVVAFFMTLKMFLCSQCANFACPLNGVDESIRQEFFRKNSEIAGAWGVEANGLYRSRGFSHGNKKDDFT
jgi:hypothetical protein